MKPSRRRTLDLKVSACNYCELADKVKMRQGRDYCDSTRIRNGHCINFVTDIPKRSRKV